MTGRRGRCFVLILFLIATAGLLSVRPGAPLRANPNDVTVKPGGNVQDADAAKNSKLWVLEFKFRAPRLIKVNIPGRGQTVCWYMWYQVTNHTGVPHRFIPEFELVTHDTNPPMVYRDEVLPTVQDAIRKIEDPTDFYKVKNSVTISASDIPPSLPGNKADPMPITGVAIWIDPNEPMPDDDAATK